MTNHPNRNWRRRARDAADRVAVDLAEKRTRDEPVTYAVDQRTQLYLLATLVAREAYLLGWEAARKDMRR